MKPIVKVRQLGKRYQIGKRQTVNPTLREAVAGAMRSPLARITRRVDPDRMIWALKDINLDVEPGEVVGIVGNNGAGKSTLLKILSRITNPSMGEAEIYGTLGSLLEVGTGFHPDLSGRENVFLNGAILGMKQREIRAKFDEIVAFSEVEKFIDTPVKRYSSGMYLRLAFAIAAHFEPDVLLLDEIIAVGDAAFQNKCIERMKQASSDGCTVFFVSHNLNRIREICSRVLLIRAGRLEADGGSDEVVDLYLRSEGGLAD